MRIITPTTIEQAAWEGYLEPLGEGKAFASGDEARVRVTLGEPVWWPAAEAMKSETGKEWTPPAGDRVYTLVRLACTLHPPDRGRTHFQAATLSVHLFSHHGGAANVIAHDLYPQRLTAASKRTFNVGLSPSLKFGEAAEVSGLEVGAEIEYQKVFPVIQGFGLGEHAPYWRFTEHAAHPLLGSQSVYVVLAAPPDAGGVKLSMALTATVQTRFGPLPLGLPRELEAEVMRVIGG